MHQSTLFDFIRMQTSKKEFITSDIRDDGLSKMIIKKSIIQKLLLILILEEKKKTFDIFTLQSNYDKKLKSN